MRNREVFKLRSGDRLRVRPHALCATRLGADSRLTVASVDGPRLSPWIDTVEGERVGPWEVEVVSR
jgi:hypothetical protein